MMSGPAEAARSAEQIDEMIHAKENSHSQYSTYCCIHAPISWKAYPFSDLPAGGASGGEKTNYNQGEVILNVSLLHMLECNSFRAI